MTNPESHPTTVRRDEQKFWLSEECAIEIERDIADRLPRAQYRDRDHEYQTTTTLYFDGPGWPVLKESLSHQDDSFKIRARRYGFPVHGPVFAEKKVKDDGETEKYRAKLPAYSLKGVISGAIDPKKDLDLDEEQQDNLEAFLSCVHEYDATPKFLVRYRRMAYAKKESRATFDRGIVVARADGYKFDLPPEKWVPFKNPNQVLLELKSDGTEEGDAWVAKLVKKYDLKPVRHSKFRHAAQELGVLRDAPKPRVV